jgi:hypothetical protein
MAQRLLDFAQEQRDSFSHQVSVMAKIPESMRLSDAPAGSQISAI